MTPKKEILAILPSLFLITMPVLVAADFNFVASTNGVSSSFAPTVIDINGDGWLETAGTLNDGHGNLLTVTPSSMGLQELILWNIPNVTRPSDIRLGDFNADGCPDLIAQGYSSTNVDTRALLYFNDGTGRFIKDPKFANLNIRGRGEGIAIADFNNDGALDIFVPYYTYSPCTDLLCPNASQSYLFLNDGYGHFREVAAVAGVSLSSPPGATPEGTQAVDVDNNGLLDLYVAGRLFLNKYVDANGIPHFQDCACGIPPPPGSGLRADEGAKFLDWNNDGKLDLVIHNWNNGPTLYENTGTTTTPYFTAKTETDPISHHPFFSTGAPNYAKVLFQDSFGINVYDLDNDGLEDMVTAGSPNPAINQCPPNSGNSCPVYPSTVFRNTGNGYEQVSAGPVSGFYGAGLVAFGDINRDGKIDILYSSNPGYYFVNNTATGPNSYFLSIEILGPNGESNQQGRVVKVSPQRPNNTTIYTRVVDGGSGYHTQNQYALFVGTNYSGTHLVQAFYSATTQGNTVAVNFNMSPGQYAQVFAPSVKYPNGRYVIYNKPPPPALLKCTSWMLPIINLLLD